MEELKKEYITLKEVTKFSYGLKDLAEQYLEFKMSQYDPKNSLFKREGNIYTKLDRDTGEKYYEVIFTLTVDDLEIIPEEEKV